MDNITMPSSEQSAITDQKTFNNVWFLFFEKLYRSLTSLLNVSGSGYFGMNNIDSSAKLQIDSTSQGFLPPRMTTTEKNAIASPATGLMVFDITLGRICVYDGAGWDTY
jgi:hypothetical protein